jgi:hypothetical protein
MMKRSSPEGGSSLLELVVAAALTVGLLGVVLAILNRHSQIFISESAVTDLNENARTAIDMLTRDIQGAGAGLTTANGNLAAIYYINGGSGADSLMMINGDPTAPTADVRSHSTGNFYITLPPGVAESGSGNSASFSYTDSMSGTQQPLWVQTSADSKKRSYVCYDSTNAQVFSVASNASDQGASGILLQDTAGSDVYPATAFGSAIDLGAPSYIGNPPARVAVFGGVVAYKLDRTNEELLRSVDLNLQTWYPVARGIISFKISYKIEVQNPDLSITQVIKTVPTDRAGLRAVIVTMTTETPDIQAGSTGYKRETHQFEVAPRNFNLVNHANVASS